MRVELDQVYRQVAGVDLRYHFFRPEVEGPVPLVVGIHGGGWISGSKDDYLDIAKLFCDQGFAGAVIQYRLAPLHPFPAAVEDVRGFVRFARERAEDWGIHPDRVASFGNSAGGHLSAMLGLSPEAEERVNAAVAICPITDVTRAHETHFPIAWSFLDQFLPWPFEGHEETFQAASPMHLPVQSTPFLIAHGVDDDIVPVAQSDALAERLPGAQYLRLPGEGHSFTLSAWREIERTSVNFLRGVFA